MIRDGWKARETGIDIIKVDVEELQSPHEKIAVTARQMTVSRSS